jgi:P27 family predicted phage terminase small subunit
MGRSGPAPKPPALRILNGRHDGVDSGGRPIPVLPMFERPEPDSFDPPVEVCEDEVALQEWRRLAPEFIRLGIVRLADRNLFGAYCLAWSRFCGANREWVSNGRPFTSLNASGIGHVVDNGFRTVEMCSRELRQAAREFGLTPSSENYLGGRTGQPGDIGPAGSGVNPFANTG